MEKKIQEILSFFLSRSVEEINDKTLIDRKAFGGSIQLHRFYARLSENGIEVEDYSKMATLGDLLSALNNNNEVKVELQSRNDSHAGVLGESYHSVGIDIEDVEKFPKTQDFRTDSFYQMNFHPAEISYAILQPNPYQTFAGFFAAKEAIIKANNQYRENKFNSMLISHDSSGKPVFQGLSISISHTANFAVSVAVQTSSNSTEQDLNSAIGQPETKDRFSNLICLASLIIALVALFIALRS